MPFSMLIDGTEKLHDIKRTTKTKNCGKETDKEGKDTETISNVSH